MKTKDLLICIREDNYTIDTLEIIPCPKINEIVEVKKVVKDIDGVWLKLIGYENDMFDINCFRKLSLSDVKSLLSKSYELVSCET